MALRKNTLEKDNTARSKAHPRLFTRNIKSIVKLCRSVKIILVAAHVSAKIDSDAEDAAAACFYSRKICNLAC